MPHPLRTAGAALVLSLAACGGGDRASTGVQEPPPTCLVTSEQLSEITDVTQEVVEVDVPPLSGSDLDALTCETRLDERDTTISWSLDSAEIVMGTLTHEDLRDLVARGDARVREVEVGPDQPAWVGTSRVLGTVQASTAVGLGQRKLLVELVGDDDAIDRATATEESVAVARAIVAALG